MQHEHYVSTYGYQQMMTWYDASLQAIQAPLEHRICRTRYGDTHVIVTGDPLASLPVVLLHGINVNAMAWAPQLNTLVPDFPLIVPDIPGYVGRSASTRIPYAGDHMARWLADVLDGLHIEQCLLVGGSAGGYFAVQAAAGLPERVRGVILLNPCGLSPYRHLYKLTQIPFVVRMLHLIARPLVAHRSVARQIIAHGMHPAHTPTSHNVELAYLLLRYFHRRPAPPVLPPGVLAAVVAPVRLLVSPYELYTDPAQVVRVVCRYVPNVEARYVTTAGHDINKEAPARVNQAIRSLHRACLAAGVNAKMPL
jgi:pimeloyl-ACP methyl ester carboxylesterase